MSNQIVPLYYREYGSYSDERPTLVFLHGLLGSSANWHTIARGLEAEYHIIVPDLRNHGRSPHVDDVGYPALAEDVSRLIDDHGLESVVLIGHSMGGKVAMWLALNQPELVAGLVVVDVAPVTYPNRFGVILQALHELDLNTLVERDQADALLAQYLEERGLRQYLLQNLVLENGFWSWRMNLDALTQGMDRIVSFPDIDERMQYLGDVLFLYGGNSNYVLPEYEKLISLMFPYTRLRSVPGAGHWVYAEKPDEFMRGLSAFLTTVSH